MNPPFHLLSTDLVLEIIAFAASPDVGHTSSVYGRRGTYNNALALASVSYDFRRATMPHLLHTVVLNTPDAVNLFVNTLRRQEYFRHNLPQLSLDYKRLVRRVWCTDSIGEDSYISFDHNAFQGYDLLYDLLSNCQSLGLGLLSLHLLYNGLILKNPLSGSAIPYWQSCRRITFAGPFFRWNPLTTTREGMQLLRQITHLTMWITEFDTSLPTHPRIASWTSNIPFKQLHSLTQLAILLVPDYNEDELEQVGQYGGYFSPHPLEMLVFSCPSTSSAFGNQNERLVSCSNAEIMEAWLHSSDPLKHGVVHPLHSVPRTADSSSATSGWEISFLEGQNICS